MCTVTFMPYGADNFGLVSNRDENRSRATGSIDSHTVGSEKLLLPKDPVSGGSWIAVSNQGRFVCILNGAFEWHRHQPPYARSRGLVLLDYFAWSEYSQFSENYKFDGIEPFTMIAFEPGKLHDLRWDGMQLSSVQLDIAKPHIWSSATLYDKKAQSDRVEWFQNWLNQVTTPQIEDQLSFHENGGSKDPYDGLIMNRDNKVQTLSITGINIKSDLISMEHKDLLDKQLVKRSFDFAELGSREQGNKGTRELGNKGAGN